MLTLIGPQGLGKSELIKRLGKDWHSDSFSTVQGKEAYEQLQGAWIIEMAELTATKRAEVGSREAFHIEARGYVSGCLRPQGVPLPKAVRVRGNYERPGLPEGPNRQSQVLGRSMSVTERRQKTSGAT